MTRLGTAAVTILGFLLLVSVILGAYQYGKRSTPAPVSVVQLKLPGNQISPQYLAVTDPNEKTVSLVAVGIMDDESTVISVIPYTKVRK